MNKNNNGKKDNKLLISSIILIMITVFLAGIAIYVVTSKQDNDDKTLAYTDLIKEIRDELEYYKDKIITKNNEVFDYTEVNNILNQYKFEEEQLRYEAYITTLKNVRRHSNADRLQVGECFGNQVIIDLSYKEGDIGIYFPTDGKLGQEFAEANNLLRKKDENGNNIGGYLDPEKRNIKAIKLRGEKSDGLFMPLYSLTPFVTVLFSKS